MYCYDDGTSKQLNFQLFQSDNTEPHILPFPIDELGTAPGKSHDTAPAPDHVHYQILKHLPEASPQCLLKIFNNIWETGKFLPFHTYF